MTGKARARVLVVEDDPTVADIVGRYLERDGFTADHVGDGETALARVETHPPDLVLLDGTLSSNGAYATGGAGTGQPRLVARRAP